MQRVAATEVRLLYEPDLAAAMQLKEAAGWNQTEHDWRRLLTLEPNGCFCAIKDGRLVGTTTTTTYGRDLAWIGMVLVDPDYRGQGIAANLMTIALDYLNARVTTVKLDATPQGKPVYEKFGFQVESLIERWSGTGRSTECNIQRQTVPGRGELRELLMLDRLAFNADRSKLIEALVRNASIPPLMVRASDGAVSGYAIARSGTKADYVGPIIAKDRQSLETLLDQVLSRLPGRRIYIDLNTECTAGKQVLADRGYAKERDLVRMFAGTPSEKTSPFIFAIAGPEIG
jgi:ribosomal protein S18 acetylase RimI-like enzyme